MARRGKTDRTSHNLDHLKISKVTFPLSLLSSHTMIAAARALMSIDDLTAEDVANRAMNIAADMCVHTNKEFLTYTLEDKGKDSK